MPTTIVYEIEKFEISEGTARHGIEMKEIIKNHSSETVDYYLYNYTTLVLVIERTYTT